MAALALRPGHAWNYQPGNCIPIRAVETREVGTLTQLRAGTGLAPIASSSSSRPPPPHPPTHPVKRREIERVPGCVKISPTIR